MIYANTAITKAITSPVRTVKAKVELYEGSALVNTFTTSDHLMEFTVERTGEESKFFGYGICQKLNVHLIDKDREIQTTTKQFFRVAFTVDNETVYPFPNFYITRTNRDENTNELSVTAYDALYWASKHQQSEMVKENIPAEFTVKKYAEVAIDEIQDNRISINAVTFKNISNTDTSLTDTYTQANYAGTETIREILDDVAEATQTIYFIEHDETDNYDNLSFIRLSSAVPENLTIGKDQYFTLDSSDNRRLGKITHSIAGVDNISASTTQTGTTQVIRDNGFWSLLEPAEIGIKLDNAIAAIGGLTINQFDLEWRGNYLLEPGDRIGIVNKEDETDISFYLNDTITFNGGLSASTSWRYSEEDEELESSPSSLGEALNQASIKVDKINSQIDMVVSATEEAVVKVEQVEEEMINVTENMSAITVSLEGINGTVQETVQTVNGLDEVIQEIDKRTETMVTPEDVTIAISTAIDANTPNEITTSTGFTFNSEGLTISKSESSLSTTITEDGLVIKDDLNTKLDVNNTGVFAQNLSATTYLVIGNKIRFEPFYDNGDRVGCFWIGPR